LSVVQSLSGLTGEARNGAKKFIAMLLAALLFLQCPLAARSLGERTQAPDDRSIPGPLNAAYVSAPPLDVVEKMSSWDIAIIAERFTYDSQTLKLRTDSLKSEFKKSENAFNTKVKAIEKQVERKEKELEAMPQSTSDPVVSAQRLKIQCEIQSSKKDLTNLGVDYLQKQNATDVQIAKLNLLADWAPSIREIQQQINRGTIGQRRYGNVLDIGNRATREPFKGQEDDVKWGQEEIEAARQRNTLPQEVTDTVVAEYVNRVATNLARNSDLETPLTIHVVQQVLRTDGKPILDKDGNSQQISDAMALPGGFLYIYAGLILDAENESELAGVIAHEISHNAARHAHRLKDIGRTFGIIQLVFELEADQLGMQYAWKTGYDPGGFLQFFDRMRQKEDYASHTSFFATHPAFGDRFLNALKEYKALQSIGGERDFIVDTSEFPLIKNRLKDYLAEAWERENTAPDKPTLQLPEPKECPPNPETVEQRLAGTSGQLAMDLRALLAATG